MVDCSIIDNIAPYFFHKDYTSVTRKSYFVVMMVSFYANFVTVD